MKIFTSVITTISFLINTVANAAPISPIEGYSAFNSLSNEIIKNLFIPQGYGSVVDRWGGGNSKKFIINIQDAHCNYEAQQNIAKILKILIMDYGIDLVGVEGAEGDLDLGQYGEYKDERAKEKALDMYVKKG